METGDLVLGINGARVNHFDEVAEVLDSSINASVTFQVFRHKAVVSVDGIKVQDLFSINPQRYLEIGNTIIHSLGFILAKQYLHPVSTDEGPVFVASAGNLLGTGGVPSHAIITSVNHQQTRTLCEFIKVVQGLRQGQWVPVRYYSLARKNVVEVCLVLWESSLSRLRIAERDGSSFALIFPSF